MKQLAKPKVVAWKKSALLLLWVGTAFIVAQLLVLLFLDVLKASGVSLSRTNPGLLAFIAVAVYGLTLAIVIFVPQRFFRKAQVSKKILGITRLPHWLDIAWVVPSAITYLLFTTIFASIALALFPGFNLEQTQDVGFNSLAGMSNYTFAFLTLVVLAPVAEELLFRGYLYGKLRTIVKLAPAVILTSLLFGAAHMQWNLAVDTFALSLVLCGLREITGSIWAGVLLHMLKNGVAFYFIFINQSLLGTLGG